MAGADTYDFGQCTWYVASTLDWVRGGWHNAGDWAINAAAEGFALTAMPTVGSVVCYAAGDGYSQFGHVAIVIAVYSAESFLVSEMNFVAFDTVDQRVSNMHDVYAFILPPGVPAGAGLGAPLGAGAGTPDLARTEWQAWADWLNNGPRYWVDQLNQVSNLFSRI